MQRRLHSPAAIDSGPCSAVLPLGRRLAVQELRCSSAPTARDLCCNAAPSTLGLRCRSCLLSAPALRPLAQPLRLKQSIFEKQMSRKTTTRHSTTALITISFIFMFCHQNCRRSVREFFWKICDCVDRARGRGRAVGRGRF